MKFDNFDKHATNYDSVLDDAISFSGESSTYFAEYKIKELYNYLIKKNININNLNILDFGCGTGKNLIFLSKYFKDSTIFGVDISKESINIAQNLNITNSKVSLFDGENIPYEDESFDIVFISNVLHHINFDLHIKILKEIKSKMKKDGLLFIFEHNPINPLTTKVFKDCPLDKDAKMLNFLYTQNIIKKSSFSDFTKKFILFIPPKFKPLLFLENYLKWLPLGAQYYFIASK